MAKFNIKGIGYIEVPDGATREEAYAILQNAMGRKQEPQQTSALGQIKEFAKGIPAGIISGVAAVPEGLGAVIGDDDLKRVGEDIRMSSLAEYFDPNPGYETSIPRQAGEVVGNLATMLAPSAGATALRAPAMVTRGLGALMSMSQGAAEQKREVDRNRAAGMEITPEQEQSSSQLGSLTGLVDQIPMGRFTRFFKPAEELAGLAAARTLARKTAGEVAKDIAVTGLQEGATEGGQQFLQNFIEQQSYNPQQALTEDVISSAVAGAGAGAGLDALIGTIARRVGRKADLKASEIRARQSAPEVLPGDEEAIGIRSQMDGTPEVKYVQQRRPTRNEILDELSLGLYGKPLSELDAQRGMHLDRSYEDLRKMGMSDQEVIDHLTQPIDLAPDPVQRPTPGLPTALPPDAPPVRLTDDGAIDASAVQYPSFLDQIIAQEPALYERLQGQDVVNSLLANPSEPRGVTPNKPRPKPPVQNAILTDEGAIATDQQPTEIRREGIRPMPTREQIIAEATAARQQAEQLKAQRRAEADAIRLQKKQSQVTVPETGIANERDADARQRVSRELFGRNFDQLTPEQITEVDSYRAEGLGEAVQPQEIAEINEFADLPFSRDQYRSALEVGRAAGVNTKPVSMTAIAKQAKVKPEVATQIINHMVTRGDAQLIDGKVIVDPTAMGPRYNLGQPTPSTNTVAAQRQLLEEGKQSELANSIFGEMQRLGVDDIVSTRLVDNLKVQPNAKGSYANQIISLAMAVQDPQAMKETLHHEAVHAMKAMGLFNDAEWNILQGALNPNSVLSDDERRQYGEIYGDRPDIIQEEAIARGLERYMSGQLSLDGPAKDIATQKMSTLQRIGNAFKSNNMQSPADVASAFKSGEIGRREGNYAINNAVANDQAGVDTERRISAEAGTTQDIPAVDAAKASEAVDPYDIRAWLTDTDESGEVKPTTEQRMSVQQLPVNGRIFAEPDSRSQIRKQIDELKSGATPGALGGAGLSLRQQALDARAGIEKLSQQVGTATNAKVGAIPAVRAADVSSEYASAALKNGGLEFVGTPGNGYFRAKKDGPAPFGKDGFFTKAYNNGKLDRVFHYIAGKRGQELMAQGREKLMTPQQIAEYVNYGNDAEVRDAAQQWKQFNDSVVDAVQASGRIDAATAADWKSKTYLPFYRVDPDTGTVTAQGPGALSGTGNIQKLKGSTREIADPIENIVRNVNALTSMAMKNEAMQRVARDGIQMGYMKQAQKGSPAKNQVTLYVDGKPKKFVVTDPILYESVTASRMPANTVMKLAAMPGNFLRESVTLSPAFMVRNMLRDSMMVWAQGYTPVPFANIAADATKALREAESFKNLERLGVVDAGIRGDGGAGGTAANIRGLMDGPTKNPLKWFQDKSKKSEAANRITVFESVMNRTGGDEAQAAFEARELLNFNRRGASPIAQVLTAMTPFLNARWQGLDVAYRSAIGKGANPQMKSQMLRRAAYLGALSTIYAALVSQLPAWQNATPEERDNNWFVPTGDGEAVKVPIPFEFGFVAKVLPERFVAAAMGNEEWTEALSSFDRFLRGNMKLDMPHVINPVYEVSNNMDRFRGREIEQPWMRKLDKDYRYDENTSELAKEVARYSSLSPVQLDHILRGYLGTSAMYAVNLADVLAGPDPTGTVADIPDRKLSQMPVFGSMFQREDGARKLLEFYEIRNVAEQAKNTLSMLAKSKTPAEEGDRERLNKAAKVETATRATDKRMSDMTKVERQVRGDIKAGNITPAQGRKVLEELRKRKLELAAPVIERYKDAIKP